MASDSDHPHQKVLLVRPGGALSSLISHPYGEDVEKVVLPGSPRAATLTAKPHCELHTIPADMPAEPASARPDYGHPGV